MIPVEFVVAFSARFKRKELSENAFNIAVSRFLKDILDVFAVVSVNDELISSAIPLAVKHARKTSSILQL